MRPRHWKALKDVTKMQFVAPCDDGAESLTLGTILDLELHRFGAAVEEITAALTP